MYRPCTSKCSNTAQAKCSLVYKGRKVALYNGAYAPSYLPNDVDTFACGVNCGNHQSHLWTLCPEVGSLRTSPAGYSFSDGHSVFKVLSIDELI